MLLNLHTQFFCSSEPFIVDHMRYQEAIGRTPDCSRQTVRAEIRPAFLNDLWRQHFNRKPKTLLHACCRLRMVPNLSCLVSSAELPCRDCFGGFVEKQVAVLPHNRLLTDICRTLQEVMEVAVPPLA